jgi:hypothetical protein
VECVEDGGGVFKLVPDRVGVATERIRLAPSMAAEGVVTVAVSPKTVWRSRTFFWRSLIMAFSPAFAALLAGADQQTARGEFKPKGEVCSADHPVADGVQPGLHSLAGVRCPPGLTRAS